MGCCLPLKSIQYKFSPSINIVCCVFMNYFVSHLYNVVETFLGTTEIKPVEIWLLGNLAYPFLVIMVNIALEVIFLGRA